MRKLTVIIAFLTSLLCSNLAFGQAVTISTFNIQNLGQSKMHHPEVVASIVSVVRSYDIVAVQEISDYHGHTAQELTAQISAPGRPYGLSLSPRTGMQEDDVRKAEQYAFFYRSDLFQVLDSHVYDDAQHDYFGREPWIVHFRHIPSNHTFTLVTIHTVPEVTVSEINALHYVVESIVAAERDVVVLGDMNASCGYANNNEVDKTLLHQPQYYWVVPNSADTNFAASSCAYDRIVLTNHLSTFYHGHWGINHSITREVSDHWPVWFQLDF